MITDCVLDLSTLSFPETQVKLGELMADMYKKLLKN